KIDIVVITDADLEIVAPQVVARIVDHRRVPEFAVRRHDEDAIGRLQFRGEQADLLDGSGDVSRIDIFADPEGLQRQQHDPGGDVLQRSLERQADRKTCGAQCGDDTGRLHTELRQYRDADKNKHRIANGL